MVIPTYEELLQKALGYVDDSVDKREGSLVFTAVAPMCALLAQAYIDVESFYELSFIETSGGEYLDRVGQQYGISRKQSTKTVRLASFQFTGAPVELLGTSYVTDDIVFEVTARRTDTIYEVTASIGGDKGNIIGGILIPEQYIPTLLSAELGEIISYGTDAENDERFRQRIVNNVRTPAFGGNKADYIEKVMSIDGIQSAYIFSANEMGAGNVGIVLGGSGGKSVTQEAVDKVQSLFTTSGLAPIGHNVTVNSCINKPINIDLDIALEDGVILSMIQDSILQILNKVIVNISFHRPYVSSAVIINAMLEIDGVMDVQNVVLNGYTGRYVLNKTYECFEVAILGEVSIGEAVW